MAEAGVGANIQHYNPVIDERVAKEWNIPTNLVLRAQMPFGEIVGEPTPIERKSRLRVVK